MDKNTSVFLNLLIGEVEVAVDADGVLTLPFKTTDVMRIDDWMVEED